MKRLTSTAAAGVITTPTSGWFIVLIRILLDGWTPGYGAALPYGNIVDLGRAFKNDPARGSIGCHLALLGPLFGRRVRREGFTPERASDPGEGEGGNREHHQAHAR